MALVYKDRVKQTVDAPSTTDPFDFDSNGATPTGYVAFVDALADADTCIYAAEDTGGNWETGLGTWAEANKTLTRTTILASSNSGSAETFTGTVTVFITNDASQVRNSHLRTVAASPTTAGITGEVGVMHVLDISGLTADRDFLLPTVCAVGDRVGVMIAVGDATYELLLKPGSGDTINGGSADAEWSRLFITGEVVIFRCVTANAAWVVESNRRIACSAKMTMTTSTNTYNASTWSTLDWENEIYDVGDIASVSANCFTVRRAGTYSFSGYAALNIPEADKRFYIGIKVNSTAPAAGTYLGAAHTSQPYVIGCSGTTDIVLAVGDTADLQIWHNNSGAEDAGGTCAMAISEVL